jgi:adenylate kinase
VRLLILGPPGSGKGTQSLHLAQRVGVVHVATGDLLRQAIRQETPLGYRVRQSVSGGRLVPDALVNEVVHRQLTHGAGQGGFLLDGFPRTLHQLDALTGWLAPDQLDAAIGLVISTEQVMRRLAARGRGDDTTRVIRQRLDSFEADTTPVLDRLDADGLLIPIDADRPIHDVTRDILAVLANKSRRTPNVEQDAVDDESEVA